LYSLGLTKLLVIIVVDWSELQICMEMWKSGHLPGCGPHLR